MTRRIVSLSVLLLAGSFLLPALGQWTRTEIGNRSVCQRDTGEILTPASTRKAIVTTFCNTLNAVEVWLPGSLAEAQFLLRFPPSVPDTLPAGWAESPILGVDSPYNSYQLNFADDVFTVGTNGGEIWNTDDSFGAYRYVVGTTSDFQITTCLLTTPQVGGDLLFTKGGLDVRDSLDAGSAHWFLGNFGPNGSLVMGRPATDGTSESRYLSGSQLPLPAGLRIEGDRGIESLIFYYSDDCVDGWTQVWQEFPTWMAAGSEVFLLLATSPGNLAPGLNAVSTFGDVVVDTVTDQDHEPASVGFDPTSYNVDEDAGTVTVTATRFGAGPGACTLNYVVNDDTAIAGTDYTDESGTFSWSDMEVGNKTQAIAITDRNGVTQGDLRFYVVLTTSSCADTLINATATVTILDQDAGASFWTTQTPSYTPIVDGLSGDGLDWTTYLGTSPAIELCTVSNMNFSGVGSFSACLNPSAVSTTLRIMNFAVGGMMNCSLGAEIHVNRDNLIINGYTAPGDGFWLDGCYLLVDIGSERVVIANIGIIGKDWPADDPPESTNINTGRNLAVDSYVPASPIFDVVILNVTGAYASDDPINVYREVERWTIQDTAIIAPLITPFEDAGGESAGTSFLIGHSDGDGDDATEGSLIRNMVMHGDHRCPLVAAPTFLLADHICYNYDKIWSQFAGYGAYARDVNAVDNLYIGGPQSVNTYGLRPVWIDNTYSGSSINLYFDGNCTNNNSFWDDATQAGLITDAAGAASTIVGTILSAARPDGFQRTMIGGDGVCDAADEELKAQAIMATNGVFPNARDPWVQQFYNHVQAAMDGVGNEGGRVNTRASSPYGMPSIASASCTLTTADSCRPGLPAVPANPAAAGAPFNAGLEYFNTSRCLAVGVGALGC